MNSRCTAAFLLFLTLVACTPQATVSTISDWAYADLRSLDAADAEHPDFDLIAAYARWLGSELQIRLDWLEQAALPNYDLYLALDSLPGGTRSLPIAAQADIAWDTLFVIPASGPIQALKPDLSPRHDTALLVVRDPKSDVLVASLNRAALQAYSLAIEPRGEVTIQAFLTPAGVNALADRLGPFRSDGQPPAPLPVLLAFWNVFPAYSPALALRRWDGAHTGPFGGRHGLFNLLRTARASGIPLALLDLKAPASLSALDYQGGLDLVRAMDKEDLLILPEYYPLPATVAGDAQDWFLRQLVAYNRQLVENFDLAPSQFVYFPDSTAPVPTGRLSFARSPLEAQRDAFSPVSVIRFREKGLLPIFHQPFTPPPAQATPAGPTLELRRALVQAALSRSQDQNSNQPPYVILGGNLPASDWGDPQAARATFKYLATHPWIRPVGAHDLLVASPTLNTYWDTAPIGDLAPVSPSSADTSELIDALRQAPANNLGKAAWQAYLALYTPVFPEHAQRAELRTEYSGQVWSLLAAARWAERPTQQATCNIDPDRDSDLECILASDRQYAQFETTDGSLTYLFIRPEQGTTAILQWVAPSSQFIFGLSEPETWQTGQGLASDPAVIVGAFAGPGKGYQPTLESGGVLHFVSPDQQTRKTFALTSGGIRFFYSSTSGAALPILCIPLTLPPWERFETGWALHLGDRLTRQTFTQKLPDGPQIQITSSAKLSGSSFIDSLPFMKSTENPNMDYPDGHYLPFPLTLIEIVPEESLSVEISITP